MALEARASGGGPGSTSQRQSFKVVSQCRGRRGIRESMTSLPLQCFFCSLKANSEVKWGLEPMEARRCLAKLKPTVRHRLLLKYDGSMGLEDFIASLATPRPPAEPGALIRSILGGMS